MIAMAHRIGRRGEGGLGRGSWVVGRWPPMMEAGPFRTLPACAYREFETDLSVDCPGFVEVQQLIGENGKAFGYWFVVALVN